MTQEHSKRKYNLIIPAILIAIFFSCTDKKEYNMELTYQRQMTAQAIRENDRILLRIEKEVVEYGKRERELVILNHAANIIAVRNKYIDSIKSTYLLIDNIKPILQQVSTEESNFLTLLNFYQTEVKAKKDSLLFQKFINVYLMFEKIALDEDLSQVSGSCRWGADLTPHVIKTTDTVSIGQAYEFAVVPETFNYKASYINDDCKINIFRNDTLVEMKSSIVRKGFVYLISISPDKTGTYRLTGSFTQPAYFHSYVLTNIFKDTFVVK